MGNIIKSFTSFSLPVKIVVILVVLLFLILPITLYAVKRSNSIIIPAPQNGIVKPTLIPFPKESISKTSIIIRYKKGSSPDDLIGSERLKELETTYTGLGVISQEKIDDFDPSLPDLSYKFTFKNGIDVERAAQEIYKLPEIENAEPNVYYQINK